MPLMSSSITQPPTSTDGVPLGPVLLKIGLLLLTGISVHLSLSPPNPPAPEKQCVARKTLFEKGILWVTFCSKMMVWVATLADAIATSISYYQLQSSPQLPRSVCPHPSSSILDAYIPSPSPTYQPHSPLFSPSLLLAIGSLAVFFGAILRLWCFQALGHLFTFEVTIHPTHSLVTKGPYSFVRHPSYTGVWFTLIGSTFVGLASGGWISECWLSPSLLNFNVAVPSSWIGQTEPFEGISFSLWTFSIMQVIVFALIAFWLVKITYALKSTHKRLHIEDIELHKVFGTTWEEYAQRVRWKLVPGIF